MTQLTEADYDIDMNVLMASIGIDPGTVRANTAQLQFLDGKAVLVYQAMRAVPPNLLAAALLRSHAPQAVDDPSHLINALEGEDPPTPTPIRRKRPTKKAVAKK